MATALQNGDILSTRIWCSLSDQAAVNQYVWSVFGVTGGAVTDQDLSNAVDLILAAAYKSWMTPQATYDGVQTYFILRAGPLPTPVKTIGSSGPGTSPAPVAPLVARAIFTYKTAVRGPGGRGRVYIPFLSSANVANDGRTTNSFDVGLNSVASVLLVPLTLTSGASSATVVWSLLKRHPRPAPPTTVQIVEAQSAGKFGQQHKGGSYGRPNSSPI